MKKFLIVIVVFLFSFFSVSIAFAQSPAPASQEAKESTESSMIDYSTFNSFEKFWPVTAGKVMGDSLYFLKTLKEDLRGLLYFSDLKKGDYNMTLSEKRLVEAEKLYLEKKDSANGQKSLQASQEKREKALSLRDKAKSQGRNTTELTNRLKYSFNNQSSLLKKMESMTEGDTNSQITNNLQSLESLLQKL